MNRSALLKTIILLLLLSTGKESVIAQQTGRMETDRPDQTESPAITKKKYFQAEIGFNREHYNDRKSWVTPTSLLKYGVANKFELRVITEFESFKVISNNNNVKPITGLLPVQIGGKIALSEEKGIFPLTSLIFHTGIPFMSSSNFKASSLSPNFRFTMQHTLSKTVSLGYNIGAEWDGESTTPSWIYTIAPGKNFGEKWYGYVELFGELSQQKPAEHGFDAGIAYYINDDLKLDISAGKGLSKYTFDKYVAIGLSFRLPI
jgi:Putative MetA-pathway of phenol degradation